MRYKDELLVFLCNNEFTFYNGVSDTLRHSLFFMSLCPILCKPRPVSLSTNIIYSEDHQLIVYIRFSEDPICFVHNVSVMRVRENNCVILLYISTSQLPLPLCAEIKPQD